ncbi:MAG: hypothetical protein AAGA56_27385 [Myxococcota bacterium]
MRRHRGWLALVLGALALGFALVLLTRVPERPPRDPVMVLPTGHLELIPGRELRKPNLEVPPLEDFLAPAPSSSTAR